MKTLVGILAILPLLLSGGIPREPASSEAQTDSLALEFRKALAAVTTPELEARKENRRSLQRRGYTDVLFHVVRDDGLWGLIAYARLSAQLEYSLPRNTLRIYLTPTTTARRDSTLPGFYAAPSAPLPYPLLEDRKFPEDPWKR